MSDTPTRKKDLPLWAGIAVIAIGLLIAGWFIWSQASGYWSGPTGVFQIPGVDPGAVTQTPRAPQRGAGGGAGRPSSIREINAGEWRVRATPFSLVILQPDAEKPPTINMNVSSTRLLPADAPWVLVAKRRLNPEAAESIGLNENQVRRFRQLPTAITHPLTPTPEQQQQLQQTFAKWKAAQSPAREAVDRELSELVTRIGQPMLPDLQARLQKQYEDYKNQVTAERWAKLKELGTSAPEAN